jgi:hypothetical protein
LVSTKSVKNFLLVAIALTKLKELYVMVKSKTATIPFFEAYKPEKKCFVANA